MYNPYNWEIRKKFKFNPLILVQQPKESKEDFQEKLLKEHYKWEVYKVAATTSIELGFMNLQDAISMDLAESNAFETTFHDIKVLKRKIEEYKYICFVLEEINNAIDCSV